MAPRVGSAWSRRHQKTLQEITPSTTIRIQKAGPRGPAFFCSVVDVEFEFFSLIEKSNVAAFRKKDFTPVNTGSCPGQAPVSGVFAAV